MFTFPYAHYENMHSLAILFHFMYINFGIVYTYEWDKKKGETKSSIKWLSLNASLGWPWGSRRIREDPSAWLLSTLSHQQYKIDFDFSLFEHKTVNRTFRLLQRYETIVSLFFRSSHFGSPSTFLVGLPFIGFCFCLLF